MRRHLKHFGRTMAHTWAASLYLSLLLFITVTSVNGQLMGKEIAEVVEECIHKCPFQNRTDDGHNGFGCTGECSDKQLCTHGCRLWEEALSSSCQDVCNVTSDAVLVKELYCVMGCNEALNHYFVRLRAKITTPPAPALVADSLTSTSLSLEWEGSRHSNLSYLVQWIYEEVAGAWQYSRNQTWGTKSVVRVENLQPFTKYRFRIAVLLSPRFGDPIVSAPSVVITTLPFGPPSSPPGELRVTALDSHRISLSWEPGPFPNGHILSYALKVAKIPSGFSALKDLAVPENSLFYIFQNLEPSVSYTASVAMRNAVGEGPTVSDVVITPPLSTAISNQQPVIILGEKYAVFQQSADILADPKIIYNTSHVIRGVGIDVGKDLLFVSDSSGSIFKSSLSRVSTSEAIVTSSTISYCPLSLSVDWLNGHLYILGEVDHSKQSNRSNLNGIVHWQIMRSDFDGKSQTVAFAGLHSKPVHIEVDPYNGYLFWALKGRSGGGLYRLDLANISNGVKHDVIPDQILKDGDLGAFTVDHTNFRILVAHDNNTVYAVSLDGREVTDFRKNTQIAMFRSVKSLSYGNGFFHWTNGEDVFTEEYNNDYFYHNKYPYVGKSFNSVLVAMRSSQPIPVAVNPPTGVQSVMGENIACVNWRAPHRLGPQGAGAWQRWAYTLHISEVSSNKTLFRIQVEDTTSYTISNLNASTEYVIKVAANTSSGTGPWSSEFIATTLSPPLRNLSRLMLWSTSEGVIKSDVTGNSVQTLRIPKSELGGMYVSDIAWYIDILYLVTNTSKVIAYNTTRNDYRLLPNMGSVGSLAVDWVGKKLYWFSPKQQFITRGTLAGGDREPIPIVTVAKELKVDSLKGYIYWNTGHFVECSRLNGENKFTYYHAEMYKKEVRGLTLDLKNRLLYWIVQGYEGTNLHSAQTADAMVSGKEMSPSPAIPLLGSTLLGSLSFFSNRLMWLQDNTHAVISDLKGQNRANLNAVTMAHIYTIAVRDPDVQADPDNKTSLIVIPKAVPHDSIKISGEWNSYNLTWKPVTNINHGQVFYEIKIEFDRRHKKEYTTTEPLVQYIGDDILPYSVIEMSVRPYTYWGVGQCTRASLWSPQGVPSSPTNPRVFVVYQTDILRNNSTEINLIFRWNRPEYPNGVIRGFSVEFCHSETSCKTSGNLFHQLMEYTVKEVIQNATYTFQVRAYTDAGYGPKTTKIEINSSNEKPIPKLAISYTDSIKVADLDLGDKHKYTVSSGNGKPEDFAVSLREGLLYWINQKQIYLSRMEETKYNKILPINGSALSIAVDWVSRMLYWSQIENLSDPYECILYRMDLNVFDKDGTTKVHRVFQRNIYIKNVQISPLTRSLFWIEESYHGMGKMMISNVDGSNIRPFFRNLDDYDEDFTRLCNCSDNAAIGFAVDLTDRNNVKIVFVDAVLKHIIQSDQSGCYCKVIVNAAKHADKGFPPSSITVDSKNIYWTNSSSNVIYLADKITGDIQTIDHVNVANGLKVVAIGDHVQPYPSRNCLYPKQTSLTVGLASRTSTSLTLTLPQVLKHESCDGLTMSTPYYTVLYEPYIPGDKEPCLESTCTTIKTFDSTLMLKRLRPFSKYILWMEVNNFYGDWSHIVPVRGPPVILQTTAEAPRPASDIRAQVLTPHSAKVEWSPSTHLASSPNYEDLIDLNLWYEIHWRTEGKFTPNQGIEEHKFIPKTKLLSNQTRAVAELQKLMPAQSYTVWVRTFSQDSATYTDSNSTSIQTYPEPNSILKTFTGPYVMHVSWLPYKKVKMTQYYIEYTELGSESWHRVEDEGSQKSDGSVNYVLQNLFPKTQYIFRLKIFYQNNSESYVWPKDSAFKFETLGDRPSPPGKPIILLVKKSVYELQWQQSNSNGSPISLYRLCGEVKQSEEDSNQVSRDAGNSVRIAEDAESSSDAFYLRRVSRETNHSDTKQFSVEDNMQSMVVEEVNSDDKLPNGWTLLYNGTKNYWMITELKLMEKYRFYVQAQNEYGWSDFSEPSDEFDFSQVELVPAQTDYFNIILGVGISSLVLLIIGGLGICACALKKLDKKDALTQMSHMPHGHDVELANLRELPRSRGGGGMFQRSPIYQPGGPIESDVSQLSHIRRDQITLTKFLGSGAFGEVFEGKARGLDGEGSCTKVAVKTLRKGATDHEKFEFLQEAQLMSNFKHQHVLSLLGVCVDNDPHFIIMELMEAGDLLSYLRARRPMLYTNDSLTLKDLLSMCLDVTRGCCYLEELHFVHRDLAARNCLVSQQPIGRIVKIGDFGLARDIYKNDYYRKEGEGLLPVRWMAVECLTDGVFSRASDVWAWAVLCWEVAALGRQPYPALSNHAVMRYVRGGGTLPQPPNCPQSLFELMKECWSYNPDQRPTFKRCLEVIEGIMETIEDTVITDSLTEEPQYITPLPEGFTNQTYFIDVNQNTTCSDGLDFMLRNSGFLCDTENQGASTSDGVPKYLELIYDEEPVAQTDFEGYEVPRTSIRSNTSRFIDQRRSFNSMYHRHSYKVPNRITSLPVQRARSFNSPTSTVQVHGPNGFKVKVLESNLNGVIYHNTFVRPSRLGNTLPHSHYLHPRPINKKVIPTSNVFASVSRSNSLSSRTSEDDRSFTPAQSEQKRLLNNHLAQNVTTSLNGTLDLNKRQTSIT